MNRFANLLLAAACALTLVGCGARDETVVDGGGTDGGGQGGGGQVDGGGETPNLGAANGELSVRVVGTPQRLLTGAPDSATVTAYVVDESNRAIAGQPVDFESSAGVLLGVSTETDEDGAASATLSLLDDYRSQAVTVTVTAGSFSGSGIVRAGGSGFSIDVPDGVVAGGTAALVATLENGAGEPIAGAEVTFASEAGNAITPATALTDIDGRVEASVASAAGDDTVTLSALEGTVTATHPIEVLTDTLEFDGIDADTRLRVGPENPVAAIWMRRGEPVANRALRFSSSFGRIIGDSLVTTDADGRAEVRLTSEAPGATTVVVADAADGEPTASVTLEFLPELSVRVLSDANRIETGGSDVANITALVTDADNKAVADQAVSFSASGGVLQGVSATTDENGVARATLRLLQDFRTQDITVTVTADDAGGEALVSADGSELEVGGPTNLIEGASAEIIAVLKAGNGEPIVNQAVTVTSERGNTITPATLVTDIDGRIAFSVDSANGNDTVRLAALEGTVTAGHSFSVSTQTLAFEDIDIDTEFEVVDPNSVTVTWTSAGAPVVGETLRFGTTAGVVDGSPTALTDADGQATFTLRSSSAGPARLTVEDATDGEPSTYVDIEFIAGAAAAIEIGASSTRVPVRGTSTITARVTDANGNPVKGKEVVFGSDDLKGGQLNPASATTAQDGEASVTFTAGNRPTEFDVGVGADDIVLSASVEGVALAPADARNRMSLSVVERALNVTLGTANKVVSEGDAPVQYWLDFVVQVADGGGTPVDGADVSLSIRPLQYAKGRLTETDKNGVALPETNDPWTHETYRQREFVFPLDELGNPLTPVRRVVTCDTEDENRNRVLDPGEDFNGNGLLDPQDPASLVASTDGRATLSGGTLSTDATGSGYLRLIYPVTNAQWAYVEVTALARGLGVEAKDTFRTGLPMRAEELNQSRTSPPNYFSPYGTDPDCSNVD